MKKIILICLVVLLAACSPEKMSGPDQCLRAQLFQQCLSNIPKGPSTTKFNDWSEVVNTCETAAYSQSLRRISQIAPECRL